MEKTDIESKYKLFPGILPLLIPILLILAASITLTFTQSLDLDSEKPLFSTYSEIFTSSWFITSLLHTFYVSITSSLISILLGTTLAYFIHSLPFYLKKAAMIYKIGLILPHISIAYLILLLFADHGLLAGLFSHLPFTTGARVPHILHHQSGIDIILAYILKETPFVIMLILTALEKIDDRLEDTAFMLGANRLSAFFTITLPLTAPSLIASFIIVFVYSFGAVEIPLLLGSNYPGLLGHRAYRYFFEYSFAKRPYAMSLAIIILTISIFIIAASYFIYYVLQRRTRIT